MKRIIGFILMLNLVTQLGFSQSFSISGTVKTYQQLGVANWLVTIESTPGIWPYYFNQVFTDSLGYYQTTGAINDSVTLQMTVSTYDCAMDLVDTSFAIGFGQTVQADFTICDPTPCVANYNYVVTDTTNGQTLQFFNTSTGPYYDVLWDFGDGTTSTETSPIHTFAPGTWVVCLIISDPLPPSTCSDVECKTLQIEGSSPCNNSFIYEANGRHVTFTGETNGNNQATYFWYFGDDTFGEGQTIDHVYPYSGTFEVTLTTIEQDSCTAVSSQFITVIDTVCNANFTWAIDSVQPNLIHFTNTSVGMQITEFFWDFGDGSTSTFPEPGHIFTPGTYEVCLTINTSNCTDIYCETITIVGTQECEAGFTHDIDPENGLTLHFNDLSIGNITTWVWDFGDGNESILQNPDHTFAQAGQYTICLHVFTADSLCQSTYCQTLTVNPSLYFPVIGQVLAEFFPAEGISVELYKSANNLPILTDTAYSGEFGAFAFYTVPQGQHFLRANPEPTSSLFGNYLPTYSGNTVLWEQAAALNVTQAISGADITLVANPSLANGNGLLSGILKEDTTLKSSLNTSVAKVPIYLFSNSKELLHATFTDTYGNFNFTNVPYGSYLVQPEITGLHAEPYPVSLEPGNSSHTGITFTIGELGIQYGIDALLPHHISSIGQPFPNPSQGHFQLLIEADQACSGQLVLSNPNGSIIKHIQLDLTSGINRLHVNTESMPAGIYALILQTNSGKHFLSKIVVL